MKTRLNIVSVGLTVAAAILLLIWPVYSNGATLLQVNGNWAIGPVMLPVAVALMPLAFRKQVVRIIATILLGDFVVIVGGSIGLFYLPAAVAMLLAACVADSTKLRDVFP